MHTVNCWYDGSCHMTWMHNKYLTNCSLESIYLLQILHFETTLLMHMHVVNMYVHVNCTCMCQTETCDVLLALQQKISYVPLVHTCTLKKKPDHA